MSVLDNNGMVFRLNDNGEGPELIRNAFLERGWKEFDEDEHEDYDWNLWWKTSRFRTSDHDNLMPWQRLNHYPKATAITKKDGLARNMKRMAAVYGTGVFNFSPCSYILPNDYTRFVADFTKWKNKHPNKQQYWICKPADLSRGRGIFLFKDLSNLQYDFNAVIQKYCTDPLLISGYKFDLRIYVCVTSFHPLNIYIHQEGLARFGTEKFDLNCIDNVFSHLTNTSINKYSPSYSTDKERIGPGCKWTLTQLRHYLHQVNIDDSELWSRIISLITMTLLVMVPQIPSVSRCFELYGFDILVDEKLKPWLLEVNFSPSFSFDCKADAEVKKGVIDNLLDLMNFQESDCERGGPEFHQRQKNIAQNNIYARGPSRGSSTGGRASSLNRGKRFSSSMSKLPRINLSESMNSNHSRSSFIEEEEEGEDSCDRLPMVTLVPGCGLPSVQHLSSRSHRSSTSSGSISAMSIGSSRLENSVTSSLSSRSTPGSRKSNGTISERMLSKSKTDVSINDLPNSTRKPTHSKENVPQVRLKLASKHSVGARGRKLTDLVPQSSVIVPAKRSVSGSRKRYVLPKKAPNHNRPWRQVSKKTVVPKLPDTSQPPVQMGNFFLVYPFNDTTRKLTRGQSNFDLRTAIKETQKQLKQRIGMLKNLNARSEVQNFLWAPIK